MKTLYKPLVLLQALLLWSTPGLENQSLADERGLEAKKAEFLKDIDEGIRRMQEHRNCVSSATSRDQMKKCRESMKSFRDARKSARGGKKSK